MKTTRLPVILLIGHHGQVGWELRRTLAPLGRLACVDYPEIDLAEADGIRKWLRETSPDVVVNAAAYTAVDKAETEVGLAVTVNGVAPGILAEEAKRTGALLVHYSTDYVFDGTKREPYAEDDTPNPLGTYGKSKLAGDQAIQSVDGDFLILRLCWVYGTRGHNFMRTIMRLAREQEGLQVVADQFGCPTWSRMVAEATALVLRQLTLAREVSQFKGVYHLSSSGAASWHRFAEAVVALMPEGQRQCRRVQAITTPEYAAPARRPAYSVLSCAKLERVFGVALPSWEESLRLALDTT